MLPLKETGIIFSENKLRDAIIQIEWLKIDSIGRIGKDGKIWQGLKGLAGLASIGKTLQTPSWHPSDTQQTTPKTPATIADRDGKYETIKSLTDPLAAQTNIFFQWRFL